MQTEKCLILAAGFGTRMGGIGKVLPKPIWPLFEKKVIDLQIAKAKQLGMKQIFVNIHHMASEVESYIKSLNDGSISILKEAKILDVGGAIHNLAMNIKPRYRGKVLVLNSDLFFDISHKDLFQMEVEMYRGEHTCVLSTKKVHKSSGYNKLRIINNCFEGVEKYPSVGFDNDYYTYTGISLVDLSRLKPCQGPSRFFDSVANYKQQKVGTLDLTSVDYLDFGTKRDYVESVVKVAKDKYGAMSKFVEMGLIDKEKINQFGVNYNARKTSYGFNFTNQKIENKTSKSYFFLLGSNTSLESCHINYDKSKDELSMSWFFP